MRALLDTHAFLWWIADDPRLSPAVREVIAEPGNEILFSAASAWEMAIKAGLGRLRVPDDLGRFVSGQIDRNGFRVLPIHLAHALGVHGLPDHHRDPFDRLLVAQSQVENLPIISRDQRLGAYDVDVIW